METLILSTPTDLFRVPLSRLLYITSDGNYSTLYLEGGEARLVTMQIGQIGALITAQAPLNGNDFARIGKSLIINLNYINYINPGKQQLILEDLHQGKYTLSASKDALKSLKEAIEAKVANL